MTAASPVVGRERERAQLRQLLEAALAGHGRLVLVSGEAGIGKTTLVADLSHEATQRGCLVLTGGCYDLTTTPPYGPWVELFRHYHELHSHQPDMPALPRQFQDRGFEDIASLEQLFELAAASLSAAASTQPLLLVLEDLHWSDPASIDLLRYLGRQLPRQPILTVASYRDDELTRSHPLFTALPLLVREAHAERLELPRFDVETLSAFVGSRYPLSDDDARTLTAYLLRQTDGNPLFAAELLRELERAQVLAEADRGWRLGNLDKVAPPALIIQMIERHLTALDPAARDALEVAAVLDQEIIPDLWQRMAGLDDETLASITEQALDARIIEPYGRSGLRFRHALIREVLYHGMCFPKRRRTHQLAAEMLAAAVSPDADAIAFHFQRADDERAADWLIEAGRRAARVWAGLAAKERYEAALDLIENDEQMEEECGWLLASLAMTTRDIDAGKGLAYAEAALRHAGETGNQGLEAWALWILGQGRCFAGENGVHEMRQGLAALQNLPAAARERVPEHFQRFDLRYLESSVIVMQALFGYYQEALAGAERYLDAVPSPERDIHWLEWGHAVVAQATALGPLGDPESVATEFHRAKEAYRRGGSAWYAALTATAELQYVTLTYQADQPAQRRRLAAEVEELWEQASGLSTAIPARLGLLPLMLVEGSWAEARELAAPLVHYELMFLDHARLALGVVARLQGDRELAWAQVNSGLPDGADTEPGSHAAGFKVELYRLAAELALDTGDTELANRWIVAHDCWLDWSGRVQGRAQSQLIWARYHRVLDDLEQARRHAEQAHAHASDPRQPLALAGAYRSLGEIDTELARFTEAGEQLRQALAWAEACAAPYEEALALLALAGLSAATGDPDQAWTRLNRARAICTTLSAAPALQQATAIAAKLAVRRGAAVHPAGLTPREVEVLLLIADGLTDAEAAEKLFISPRTVGQHLRSVYNKLGVNSRVEATRFAVEQGLTASRPDRTT